MRFEDKKKKLEELKAQLESISPRPTPGPKPRPKPKPTPDDPPDPPSIEQRISSLQRFVDELSGFHDLKEDCATVFNRVKKNSDNKKPLIRVELHVSKYLDIFEKKIRNQSGIDRNYLIRTSVISPEAFLSVENREASEKFQLLQNKSIVIGRDPNHTDICLDDGFLKVHGQHLKVIYEIKEDSPGGLGDWYLHVIQHHQTNPTFVNGQKVIDSKRLEENDHILLGGKEKSNETAELTFSYKYPLKENDQNDHPEDILCLILDERQVLLGNPEQIINSIQDSVFKAYLFVVNGTRSIDNLEIEETVNQRIAKLSNEKAPNKLKFIVISAEDFESENPVGLRALKQSTGLQNVFKEISGFKFEDILLNRSNFELQQQISKIEKALVSQQKQLEAEIESATDGKTLDQLKEQIKTDIKKVRDDTEVFFKDVKFEITKSKNKQLDNFTPKSVNSLLSQHVKNLDFKTYKKSGERNIKLVLPESAENGPVVERSTFEFCREQLRSWTEAELKKIDEGLNRHLQECKSILSNILPGQEEISVPFPGHRFDASRYFEQSEISPPEINEIPVKGQGIGEFFRRNLMGVAMSISVLMLPISILSVVFWPAESGQTQTMPGFRKFIFDIAVKFRELGVLGSAALLLLFAGVIWYLIYRYRQTNTVIRDESLKKLRKQFITTFEDINKTQIELTTQEINRSLEKQEANLKKSFESIDKQLLDSCRQIGLKVVQIREEQTKIQKKLMELKTI